MISEERIKQSLRKLNKLLQPPLEVKGKRILEFRFWLEVDEDCLKEMVEQPNILYLDELISVLENSLTSRTMKEKLGSSHLYKLPDWVEGVSQVECVLPKGFEV